MSLFEILAKALNISLINAAIRIATPILFAALCASITQNAGILLIGTEGIMLMGAFIAVAFGYLTGSWILGVLAAMLCGMLVAGILAVGKIRYNASMPAICTGMNMFALYFTRFLLQSVFHISGTLADPRIPSIPVINFGFLPEGSVLATIFNGFCYTDWFAFIAVILLSFFLYKTPVGLRLRAVGYHPMAAETAGINVKRIQYFAILFAGAVGGLAGAHLSLGYSTMFVQNMTNGRGFMGIAAMFFGNATPGGAIIGSLIFGFFEALGNRMQPYGIPSAIMLALPYMIVLIVLVVSVIARVKKEQREKSSLHAKG